MSAPTTVAPKAVLPSPMRWGPILRARASRDTVVRTRCAVRRLIDGPTTFGAMADAVATATSAHHYVYLLGWTLHDDFPLVRGQKTSTLAHLLREASARGAQIRAMVPFLAPPTDPLDRINKLSTGAAINDQAIRSIGFLPILTHHQKVLIVKGRSGLIGFCGGLDLNRNRVEVTQDDPGSPLHDMHCRVAGPAGFDLLQTFIRRWQNNDLHAAIDRKQGALLGLAEAVPPAVSAPAVGPTSSVPHTCCVAVARTFTPTAKPTTLRAERDIRALTLEAIRSAQRFIYVEDQYLINLEAAAALRAAVPHLQHLTILINATQLTTDYRCPWTYRKNFLATLTAGLSSADVAKIRIFQRVTPPVVGKVPVFGEHTYVHAKLWIVDDELAIVGSANIDRRGWESDSEASLFIFDDVNPRDARDLTFAQELRMALWAEHLAQPAANFIDGVGAASAWVTPTPQAQVMPYAPGAGSDSLSAGACSMALATDDPPLPPNP